MAGEEVKAAEAERPGSAANTDAESARSRSLGIVSVRTGRVRMDAPESALAGAIAPARRVFDYRAIRGVIPTVLTPYDATEQVDAVALRAQVRYLLDAGVHGLLLLGSFGESPYLNDSDREMVIRTGVETASDQVPVIVGITAQSTFVAAEQMQQAQRLDASAVMVCLPQYFRLQFDDVKRHYARLSDLNLLPILYYHYPAASGLNLKPAQIAELLKLPNIVGIKESTFDMLAIRRHIALTRGLDRIYVSGSELNFVQFMDLGGHGVVGAGALIMPRTAAAMYQAYGAGNKAKARALQSLLFETMPLAKDVSAPISLVRPAFLLAIRQGLDVSIDASPTHARLKAALAHRGIPIKPKMRSPLPDLTPRDEAAVEQAMKKIEEIEGIANC